MKVFVSTLVLLLVFSCNKDSIDLGPDYHKLIGHWKNINGDENIRLEFSKRGKCTIDREFARGGSLYFNEFEYMGPSDSGVLLHSFLVKSKKYERFGYSDALYIFSNNLTNFDTISLTGFWLIENSTYQYDNVLFVRE